MNEFISGKIKAVIFDFDGTLAVLNIDFSSMRDRVFELMRHFGVEEEWVRERYLLEIIDEVYPILWEKSPSGAEEFYQKAHQILHEVELRAAGEGKLIPERGEDFENSEREGNSVSGLLHEIVRMRFGRFFRRLTIIVTFSSQGIRPRRSNPIRTISTRR